MFAAIGYGRVKAQDVARTLRPEEERGAARSVRKLRGLFRREKPAPRAREGTGIRVEGHDDVLLRFGQCCAPLPGDEIVGFVTRGRGVTVHARDCRVVFALDAERMVEVEWEDASALRRATIRVTSRDEPGLLAVITRTISEAGVNIAAARIRTHENNTATQNFDLWVKDARTIEAVIREIMRIQGVHAVERVRG